MEQINKQKPSVYLIVLNYKGKDDTVECIQSIRSMEYDNYKIVLIDNHSQDGSDEFFVENYQGQTDVHYIQTGKNLGYAGGNNIGIQYALDQGADYVCILNNDVTVNADTIQVLVEYLENNPDVGTVGPVICDYKDNNYVQSAGANVNLYKGEHSHCIQERQREKVLGMTIDCDFITGACMLMKSQVIREVGMIPDVYFLCWEETEWCTKIKKSGKRVVCYGGTWVAHKAGASMGIVDGLGRYYWMRNSVVYEKRNASLKHLLVYYPYLFVHTAYCVVKGVYPKKMARYYMDGLFNRIDPRYKIGE